MPEWLSAVARSKVFIGANALALAGLLLLAGLRLAPGVAANLTAGRQPPQPAISISGPGTNAANTSVTAYILG
ncbi:MAG: hypothetical protein ACRDID_16640, partial [Ktedonobacterales bacterium]